MKTRTVTIALTALFLIGGVVSHAADDRPHYILADYQLTELSPDDLMQWKFLGKGKIQSHHRQISLLEEEGSAGVLLVSPTIYDDLVVSYDVMTLHPASVTVALMALSNQPDGGMEFAAGYNGSLGYVINECNAYMIAFNNNPHNRFPFINRFPAMENPLAEASRQFMQPGVLYRVDVGKEGDRIWLAIDGVKVVDAKDPDPLGKGHFAFRIRGTAGLPASCLIRNVKIYTK